MSENVNEIDESETTLNAILYDYGEMLARIVVCEDHNKLFAGTLQSLLEGFETLTKRVENIEYQNKTLASALELLVKSENQQ